MSFLPCTFLYHGTNCAHAISARGQYNDRRSVSQYQTSSNGSHVYARGHAEAHVRRNGKELIAMAQSSRGAAYIYSDGKETKYAVEGNGRVVEGDGVVYAEAGRRHRAVAYTEKLEKKHRKKGKRVVDGGVGEAIGNRYICFY